MEINLKKSAENFRISLEKKGVAKMPEMEMAVIMDVSLSFEDEHKDGITDALLTRLVPWGMTFDPDKKVDLFTFSSGSHSAYLVGSVDEKNYENYIPRNVIKKVPGYNGGTNYHYVLDKAFKHFGWGEVAPSGGFLRKLFGGNSAPAEEKRRAILFFITDGEASDNEDTNNVVRRAETEGYEVFIVMIGVSNQDVNFSFLANLDKNHKNVSFHEIKKIRDFVAKSDEQINDFFLRDKLIAWLKR